MNDVIRNLYKAFKDNLTMYVYKGNAIDISVVLDVKPSTTVGNTAVSFIVTGLDASATLDTLKNRYMLYNDKYRRITNFVPLTQTITIASTFGESISTSSTIKILVLDSLFVDTLDDYPITSQLWNKSFRVMFDCALKTRQDWDKTKQHDYFEEIKGLFYSTYRLSIPLYNDTYTTVNGRLNIDDGSIQRTDVSFLNKSDSATGFAEYRIRFNGTFSKKY